jgi:ribonuclease HIII
LERIGTDESGKGDYFGPLVVGAVYADGASAERLAGLGVADSKKLSDKRVLELGPKIRELCPSDVVRINPLKYNHLHAKFGNLNVLLAWAHARAIENLLGRVDCKTVISDQFGDEKYLREKLMRKGRKVELIQRPRAEDDAAVAAASVIARAEFLRSLEYMAKAYGLAFPKGASDVVHAGRMFVAAYGSERLPEVAKTHFKTTAKIVGGALEPASPPAVSGISASRRLKRP